MRPISFPLLPSAIFFLLVGLETKLFKALAARMSKQSRNGAARVAQFQTAEESDAPSVCAVCLGPSKFVNMVRTPKGAGCRNCGRPFTTFSWKASSDAKVRKTVICQQCAAEKNACQSCFCDLASGLSLAKKEAMSPEDLQRVIDRKTKRIEETGDDQFLLNETMKKRRFEKQLCSFFLKGFCSKGDRCTFRHVTQQELDAESKKVSGPVRSGGDDAHEEGDLQEQKPGKPVSPPRPDVEKTTDVSTKNPSADEKAGAEEKSEGGQGQSLSKTVQLPPHLLSLIRGGKAS
jgi:hypothetical protein